MELKKNPKKDLNRNSGMYFVMGLFLVLMLTFVSLEWKSFYKPTLVARGGLQTELTEVAPPLTFVTPPPPQPPPVAPTFIEIAQDDPEIIETIMKSTEGGEEIKILEMDDIEVGKVEEEIDVDWVNIEEVPVFPGCENEKDKRACFQTMMNKHIGKVFRYPEMAQEMGIQGRVYTQFTIQKDGTIGDIKLRGPDKILETEAQRIIDKLPKMKPGKQRDQNVKVAFTIPITFKLQ
jgi:protein TonB